MRPWQPDLFTKTPDPTPLERRPGREPEQKGFCGKRKSAEMSEKTVLALAEWANSQPAVLKKPRIFTHRLWPAQQKG